MNDAQGSTTVIKEAPVSLERVLEYAKQSENGKIILVSAFSQRTSSKESRDGSSSTHALDLKSDEKDIVTHNLERSPLPPVQSAWQGLYLLYYDLNQHS